MNCLLLFVYVDGLGRNCVLLHILVDAGGFGSRGGFVVWKCEIGWLNGLAGILVLLSPITGLVLIEMSLMVLSADGLGRSVFYKSGIVWSCTAENHING